MSTNSTTKGARRQQEERRSREGLYGHLLPPATSSNHNYPSRGNQNIVPQPMLPKQGSTENGADRRLHVYGKTMKMTTKGPLQNPEAASNNLNAGRCTQTVEANRQKDLHNGQCSHRLQSIDVFQRGSPSHAGEARARHRARGERHEVSPGERFTVQKGSAKVK